MISITIYKSAAVLYTVFRGKEYERVVSGKGEAELLLEALKHINFRDDLEIYSGPQVYGVLKNKWLERWAENGWVNSKGRPVRDKETGQQVYGILKNYPYTAKRRET